MKSMDCHKKQLFVILNVDYYNKDKGGMDLREATFNEQELLASLKDSGICPEAAEAILGNARSGKWERVTQLILSQRTKLVSDVHIKQDNLYCMDFLLQQLKETRSRKKKGTK